MIEPARVVILGGGYGGLAAARRLGRRLRREGTRRPRPVTVTLVDRHPYHLLETRLHEAVGRGTDVTLPIERALEGLPVVFHRGDVEQVDLAGRRVLLAGQPPLPYDALVIALGSQTNFYGIPGLAEHALELKDLEDVHRIRHRVEQAVAAAAAERNPQRRRALLTIVIGGGGLTGVELAAELADRVTALARRQGIPARDVDLIVVEMGPRILPTLDDRMSRRAARVLEERGIRILARTRITEARPGAVRLEPGGWIEAGVVIWTGGIKAAELLEGGGSPVRTGRQGRLVVEPSLMLQGHRGVFAVGDIALAVDPATGESVPAAAQLALQQGEVAADNVLAWLEARALRVYRPRWLGELVSLGRYAAIGWTRLPWAGRLRLVGYLASLLKWVSQARYEVELGGSAGLFRTQEARNEQEPGETAKAREVRPRSPRSGHGSARTARGRPP